MRRLLIPLLLSSTGAFGCASGAANTSGTLDQVRELHASVAERDAHVARLEQHDAELQARDRRLRAELALARADARELRGELEMRRRTHQLGSANQAEEGGWVEQDGFAATAGGATSSNQGDSADRGDQAEEAQAPAEPVEEPAEDDAPRPVLRLYGTPEPAPEQPSVNTATLSPGTFGVRPAIAPLPAVSAQANPPAVSGSAAPLPSPQSPLAAPEDAAVQEYRAALAMVRDRRFDEALPALERFVAAHPDHPYADNALYWRGEVFFLRHQFPQALREYTRLLSTYPDGNKVADALLRSGICHLRMGDAARARASFRRLRESYPQSVAARTASREDAS